MKHKIKITRLIFRMLMAFLLVGFIMAQSNCGAPKRGMVPCPCEKKSRPR